MYPVFLGFFRRGKGWSLKINIKYGILKCRATLFLYSYSLLAFMPDMPSLDDEDDEDGWNWLVVGRIACFDRICCCSCFCSSVHQSLSSRLSEFGSGFEFPIFFIFCPFEFGFPLLFDFFPRFHLVANAHFTAIFAPFRRASKEAILRCRWWTANGGNSSSWVFVL